MSDKKEKKPRTTKKAKSDSKESNEQAIEIVGGKLNPRKKYKKLSEDEVNAGIERIKKNGFKKYKADEKDLIIIGDELSKGIERVKEAKKEFAKAIDEHLEKESTTKTFTFTVENNDDSKPIGNVLFSNPVFANPYIIRIKNNTDEKIYDVNLFNYEHEKQRKLSYDCCGVIDYNHFLRLIQHKDETISKLRMQAFCDYGKFTLKQVNCEFRSIDTRADGRIHTKPYRFAIDKHQYQSGITDKGDLSIKLNKNLQLQLEFLMPETEVTITIFPLENR